MACSICSTEHFSLSMPAQIKSLAITITMPALNPKKIKINKS
jgi:hypothetical protein